MSLPDVSDVSHKLTTVQLDQLLLDPNNFRFVDRDGYEPIADARIAEDSIQRRTRTFLQGDRQSEIKDLLDSIRINGWRPVDNIQVRPFPGKNRDGRDYFLVVEGNRRVATLQWLKAQHQGAAGADLGLLKPAFFDHVPVYLYDGSAANDLHYMVLMGLKHISGNKKWPAINQARFLRRLVELGEDRGQIGKRIGISTREINLSLNTLALCDLYQESEYGEQFKSDRYNLFREVVNKPEVREWLGWSYEQMRIRGGADNLNRLFSWISDEDAGPQIRDESDDSTQPQIPKPAAISTGAHVRDLERIINDPDALRVLDRTRSLRDALLSSKALLQDKIEEAVSVLDGQVNALFGLSDHLTQPRRRQVEAISGRLQKLLSVTLDGPRVSLQAADVPAFNDLPEHHFDTIDVKRYRGLSELRLEHLQRVNVVGGLNNAGKTSLLEAIYLLSQQSRFDALVELMQWRAHDRSLSPSWLWDHLPREIAVEGKFDSRSQNVARLQVTAQRETNPDLIQTGYLGTVQFAASYAGEDQNTTTHMYEDRAYETRGKIHRVLCPALFSTPFMMQDLQVLSQLWNASIQMRVKEKVITFLRDIMKWRDLEQIDLTSQHRFLVTDGSFDRAVDLSTYGEGVQRMFQIGLLFGRARNGIVLIDEFENAIHASLLKPFAIFLDELAREFHTQVILTTHSRECIQAFAQPDVAENVTYYALQREGKSVRCGQLSGTELADIFDATTDFEPRRLQ